MNELVKVESDIVLPVSQFTPVGWTPRNGLSYEEWREVGRKISLVADAVNWWIGDWIKYGEFKSWGDVYAQAFELFDGKYELETLRALKRVSVHVEMGIRIPILSWNHHREVAKIDDRRAQSQLLKESAAKGLKVRELRAEVRRYERNLYLAEKGVDLQAAEMDELPSGVYRIIYADPPWAYDNRMMELVADPTSYYPPMNTEDIAALPVSRLAASDAVLFLWSTSPHLPAALQVAQDWGFEYKAMFVWDKVKHNKGYYNSVRHELLLICTRGGCTPDVPTLYDSVVTEERGDHSVKPEVFRQMIDELYVHGRRVELFARRAAPGWDAWGNECN